MNTALSIYMIRSVPLVCRFPVRLEWYVRHTELENRRIFKQFFVSLLKPPREINMMMFDNGFLSWYHMYDNENSLQC